MRPWQCRGRGGLITSATGDRPAFPLPLALLLEALTQLDFSLAISTSDGRIRWSNEALERLLGYDSAEVRALPHFGAIVHPTEREALTERNRRRVAGEPVPAMYETVFARKDGAAVPVEVAIKMLRDGDQTWVMGLIRDISTRKTAEAEVRRLAAIVASTSDAVVSVSLGGVITSWNPAAERLLGYPASEAIGQPMDILAPSGASDMPALVAQVRAGGTITDHETVRRHRDGSHVPVSLSASAIVDDTGQVIGLSATYRDIAQRLRADEERRRRDEAEVARAEAVAANHAKSEFLSQMSHELRTPLNAILGFAQLLAMDAAGASDSSVQHILTAGRHLLALIDEILDLARIEAGRTSLALEPVRVGDIVAEAMTLVRPLADAASIELRGGAGDAASQYVRADRQRAHQVLLNLLSNAVKYNRHGGRVDVTCESGRAGRLRITVTDTGPGIAAGDMKRLFTPFDRLRAEASGIEGTGLGLAVSKGLVELMGGRIGASSEQGRGSSFWFELQAVSSLAPDEGALATPAAPGRASGVEATLLYIEDNPSNIRLVERILVSRRPHLRLVWSSQAEAGLALARQDTPDLILLDLHLPDRPGAEVLDEIQRDPVLRGIPVVVLSADATERQSRRLLRGGARAYMTKPLDVRQFLDLIDEVLGSGEG